MVANECIRRTCGDEDDLRRMLLFGRAHLDRALKPLKSWVLDEGDVSKYQLSDQEARLCILRKKVCENIRRLTAYRYMRRSQRDDTFSERAYRAFRAEDVLCMAQRHAASGSINALAVLFASYTTQLLPHH